jgi:hypothetical protein
MSNMRRILQGKKPKAKKTTTVDLGAKGSFKVKKGALHQALGIPAGTKIPQSKLAPKPGDSPRLKRMKASARGLEAMHH